MLLVVILQKSRVAVRSCAIGSAQSLTACRKIKESFINTTLQLVFKLLNCENVFSKASKTNINQNKSKRHTPTCCSALPSFVSFWIAWALASDSSCAASLSFCVSSCLLATLLVYPVCSSMNDFYFLVFLFLPPFSFALLCACRALGPGSRFFHGKCTRCYDARRDESL